MNKKEAYELVLMIRPDTASRQISDIAHAIMKLIQDAHGEIIGSEYWGFRTLAYRVKKRAKAHYVYLAFAAESLDGIYQYLKFHADVLRFLMLKQDSREIVLPTPLFYSTLQDLENNVENQNRGDAA